MGIFLLAALLAFPALAIAQAPAPTQPEPTAPVAAAVETPNSAAVAAAGRPSITVTDFEYGAVAAQMQADKRTRRAIERMGTNPVNFASQLGVGVADMLVEKLIAANTFRVFERKQLTAVLQEQGIASGTGSTPTAGRALTPARYMIAGSITRLGFEDKRLGGIGGSLTSAVIGLGAKKSVTEVSVTARVIDTQTGEILASFTGEGMSTKGWGLTVFGMGGSGGGGGAMSTENFRESAVGEATDRAVQSLSELIVRLAAERRLLPGA